MTENATTANDAVSSLWAHSAGHAGTPQTLLAHLSNVAMIAAKFAAGFGGKEVAFWAGHLHDLGKLDAEFQRYLRDLAPKGTDHKWASAAIAGAYSQVLPIVIAGHHGGLPSLAAVQSELVRPDLRRRAANILAAAQSLGLTMPSGPIAAPRYINRATQAEFFIRMLFSALVDADWLDTEAHVYGRARREENKSVRELFAVADGYVRKLMLGKTGPVNEVRRTVYEQCVSAAELASGFFRLTVPTGGGKTLAGLAFALRHACTHGLQRAIFAIPLTSIIEQTAGVYRKVLGKAAVLEHHSNVVTEEQWQRKVAADNWDVPVVVTTTVQLFESLFDNRPSRCRKLHNIAESVIVLDEVQALPLPVLQPIIDALKLLVEHYRVSVVFCTATQPALEGDTPFLKGVTGVRDIIPDPQPLFAKLKRVNYEHHRWTWSEVAQAMAELPQVLTIVNTKKDAITLLDTLNDPNVLHLSTLLCAAHRRAIIDEVKCRLKTGVPCRIVSTQVVEAGVDLDFPVVFRATGPLDRIIQAAGRCNREGLLASEGRVVVFDALEGGLPRGAYRTATDVAGRFLADGADLHSHEVFKDYFRVVLPAINLDTYKIDETRDALDFTTTAERFRMIADDTVPVAITSWTGDPAPETAGEALAALERGHENPRIVLRRLQPYIVNVSRRSITDAEHRGLVRRVTAGLWHWLGRYDDVRGIVFEGQSVEEFIL